MAKLIILLVLAIILLFIFFFFKKNISKPLNKDSIRYVALGDSYTIGEGVSEEQSWPSLLVNHLNEQSISIVLVSNPSVTGWTTQDVIDRELPIFDNADPQFATLLIGVNDWVQGVDKSVFKKNLNIILDRMQLKVDKNIVLITIPDFSASRIGSQYAGGRDISKGIQEFNNIIKDEGKKRNIPVVDIFILSQGMKNNPELVASDGLHPSAKEYALWENMIYPEVYNLLKK